MASTPPTSGYPSSGSLGAGDGATMAGDGESLGTPPVIGSPVDPLDQTATGMGASSASGAMSGSAGSGGATGAGMSGGGMSGGYASGGASAADPLSAAGAAGMSGGVGGGLGGSAAGVKEQVKEQVSALKSKATEQARGVADQGKEKAASLLGNVAGEARTIADKLGETQAAPVADLARKAADSVEQYANRLRERSLEEVLTDVRNLVRQNPAVAIGAAAALGFALSRFLKAGDDHAGGYAGGSSGRMTGDDHVA